MAAARCLLAFCVLTWVHCMAQLDGKSLGTAAYTDCLPYTNSKLNISAVTLSIDSWFSGYLIDISLTIGNPAALGTPAIVVADIYWALNFTTPFVRNITLTNCIIPAEGTNPFEISTWIYSNQFSNSGWIPFQIAFYSSFSELACWEGSAYFTSPSNPSHCLDVRSNQLNMSSVSTHTNEFDQPSYLTFKIENIANTSTSLTSIDWYFSFNNISIYEFYQNFIPPVALAPGESVDLSTDGAVAMPNGSISWFEYASEFYDNKVADTIACWRGNQVFQPSPPNPTDCFNGNSLLNVNNIALHPSLPNINDSIYLTFEVENQSDENVTFNDIYWTLAFITSSPIAYNVTLLNLLLPPGQFIGLSTNAVTLSHSVSPGAYPYQFVFYSNFTTEIACWGGNVIIPNQFDCLSGGSQLIVANVILNPNSPQINDPVNLTFTIENESGGNVAFNDIYWTLTFDPSSPLSYNQTLGGYVSLTNGTSLTLNGNSLTLNESVSAGAYPYQLEFYDNATKIACWVGEVVVPAPNPSSSIYFLEDYRTEHPFMS